MISTRRSARFQMTGSRERYVRLARKVGYALTCSDLFFGVMP